MIKSNHDIELILPTHQNQDGRSVMLAGQLHLLIVSDCFSMEQVKAELAHQIKTRH